MPAPLNATVPNVLLFGDSISSSGSGYLTNVIAMLGPSPSTVTGGGAVGNAQVQPGPNFGHNYCGTSFGALTCIEGWITSGYTGWDVIHFNWGLHDIDPKAYVAVTAQQYAENLEKMYEQLARLLAPGGTLIWASTTPVPPSYNPSRRNNSDVVKANAQARALFGPASKHPVKASAHMSKVRRQAINLEAASALSNAE